MKLFQSLVASAFMLGLASGQSIDPSSVDEGTRDQWCESQISACPLICLQLPGASGSPKSNTCDSKTLDYTCICSNNMSPNASQYSQTIPYFECTEQNNQCVNNCNGAQACQSNCRTQNPCGAQNPKRVNITTTAPTTASSTAPPTDVVYTGFGTASTGGAKAGGSPMTMSVDIGRVYGLFIVIGGIFAGFTVLL